MEKEEQALPTVDRRKKQGQAVMCSCGARIPVDKVYCPRCGKRRPRAWKCQKCGQLTTNEDVSCPVCGGKLSEIISTPTEKPKVNKKGVVFILLAAVLALAAIIVLCIGPGKNDKKTNLDALNNAIQEKINEEMIDGDELPANFQYVNAMLNAISFEVKSNSERKSSAQVEFTYIDALALAESFGEEISDPEIFYLYCIEMINSQKAPTITEQIKITYTISDTNSTQQYYIDDSLELSDVLTGGISSKYMEMVEEVAAS